MDVNVINFGKKHWAALAGGIFGLLVLYYLVKQFSSGASAGASSSPDLSGSTAVQNLSAAASLQNAQINGQVESAALTANVQDNQIAAQLAASLANTSAEKTVALGAQATDLAKTRTTTAGAVSIQKLQSQASVDTAAIQGKTLTTLGADQADVQLSAIQAQRDISLSAIGVQTTAISTVAGLISSGALNKGGQAGKLQTAALTAALPGGAAPAIAIAGSKQPSTAASIVSSLSSAASSIFSGLF